MLALVTWSGLPDLAADDRLLRDALAARGCDARAVVWDDLSIDWNAFDSIVEIAQRMDEGPCWVAIARTYVGTVAAVMKERGLYVRSMAVLPEMRGHGVARRMLEEVERYARKQNCTTLFLST